MSRGFLDEDDGASEFVALDNSHKGDIALAGTVKATGRHALLFNNGTRDVWVPYGHLRGREDDPGNQTVTIMVPEWFAKKEGLI